MQLGSIDKLIPTSLISAEELATLSGFIPTLYAGKDGTRCDVQGFDGNVLIDIGSGLTGFLAYLEPFLKSRDVILMEVDPIYGETNSGERKKIIQVTIEYFKSHMKEVLTYLGEYSHEEILPILVADSQNLRKALVGYDRDDQGSKIRREVSTDNIQSEFADIVTMNHLFYSSNEPLKFLREILRILKPGGRCVIIDYETSDSLSVRKLLQCISEENLQTYRNQIVVSLSSHELSDVIEKFTRFS